MIRHHLANLAAFDGRERRGHYWPWAALVSVLMAAGIAAVVAQYLATMNARTERFAATIRRTGELPPDALPFGPPPEAMHMLMLIGIVVAVATLLLIAATVRRLHDRDASGIWAMLPLPPLLFMAWAMPTLFTQFPPVIGLYFALVAANFVHTGAMIALIVLLARRSTPGPNRYGDPDR
jgi:uncharacterized membrane protein YhaH (DUF805 family)